MKNFKAFILALALLVGLFGLSACSGNQATSTQKTTITYSAAASLQTTLTQLGKSYEKAHPDVTIHFDFAGSGAIREKVAAGAPIDGIFLASQSDITKLGKHVTAANAVLGNQLVLIAPVKSDKTTISTNQLSSNLTSASKIAIGEPASVPAGMYAEQTLTKLGLWKSLQAKFVQASDVTQVLSYVAAGNADLGFVYKTDALTSSKVKVLLTIPDSDHEPIRYYTAVVADSKAQSATKAFNSYLASTEAQKVFTKAGFTSLR